MAYVYAPLRGGRKVIRIATILPGQFNDDLRITLSQAPLRLPASTSAGGNADRDAEEHKCEDDGQVDDRDEPANGRYTALSYVWGTTADPKTILVSNGDGIFGTLDVTPNLEEALRYLRWTHEPRVMWIDAICINQADLDERSKQVTFMAQLYNLARNVVVWLGPERDDGEYALTLLKSWGDRIAVDWVKSSMKLLEHHESGEAEGGDADTEPSLVIEAQQLNNRQGWALYHLMHREWFERLWVRQEILAVTPKSFRCGNTEFDAQALTRAVFMLQRKDIWVNMPADETLRYLERRKMIYELVVATADTRPIESLRFDLSGLKWGVPVDAIYASQNLLTSLERKLKIVPDYTLPVTAVFQDVAIKLINYADKLMLLQTCELGSKSIPELPSWVPDWSSQIKVVKMDIHWSASAWISAIYSFEPGNILRAAGIPKATVRTVRDLAVKPQNQENRFYRIAIHMWELLQGDDLSAPYVGGGDMSEAYTKTFAAEYVRERYDNPAEQIELHRAREYIKALKSVPTREGVHGYIQNSGAPGTGSYLTAAFLLFRGRSFITTDEGYIGLAPQDARPGDVVSVILGCRMPMLLRPVADATSPQIGGAEGSIRWEVVGPCYISGLMYGEAIYGKLSEYLTPIMTVFELNMQRLGLKDSRTGEIDFDCVAILERHGVKVDRVLHDPWRMHVSMDALKDKGIAVEMMDIV